MKKLLLNLNIYSSIKLHNGYHNVNGRLINNLLYKTATPPNESTDALLFSAQI